MTAANHIFGWIEWNPPRQGPPVLVRHVAAGPPAEVSSFAFPEALNFTPTQLTALSDTNWTGKNFDFPWPWAHGGAPLGEVAIKLVLRGNRNDPVRISDMHVTKQCQAPIAGTLFYSPSAGEGSVPQLGFNLDKPQSIAQHYKPDNFTGDYFADKTITLSYGEEQEILITATTRQYYCSFWIDTKILDGVNVIRQSIGNGKQPFKVTAARLPAISDTTADFSAYERVYVGGVAACNPSGGGKWEKVDPHIYNGLSESCR